MSRRYEKKAGLQLNLHQQRTRGGEQVSLPAPAEREEENWIQILIAKNEAAMLQDFFKSLYFLQLSGSII